MKIKSEEITLDVLESETEKNEDSKFSNNDYEEIILGPFL